MSLDFIVISQGEMVDYAEYSRLPLDRLDLYRSLVFPRMVYHNGEFRSHIGFINSVAGGNCSGLDLRGVWNLPSLGGMFAANYLLSQGFSVAVVNNIDTEWERFCAMYEGCATPPLVGLSTTFHLGWNSVGKVVRRLRRKFGRMPIVLGGAFIHSVAMSEGSQALAAPMAKMNVEYALTAMHSEYDLASLLSALKGEARIEQVPNLAYLNGGRFETTSERWNPPLLDETPVLWHELDLPFVRRTIQTRVSSGCPFRCAFCSYPTMAKGFHLMRPEQFERQLKSLTSIPGVERLVFVDDTLNVPKERFKELLRILARHHVEWDSFLRVQFVDDETAMMMRDSGCSSVYLGIESASDLVLKNMNKRVARLEYEKGVGFLKKYGITSVAAFVLGFPGETTGSVRENIDFISATGIDFYTLKEFYYMEHTPIHECRESYGLSGNGNKWAHSTMTSDEAGEHRLQMFQEIRDSIFLDADLSLWYLVALRDAGLSMTQIKAVQKEVVDVVRHQLAGSLQVPDSNVNRINAALFTMF